MALVAMSGGGGLGDKAPVVLEAGSEGFAATTAAGLSAGGGLDRAGFAGAAEQEAALVTDSTQTQTNRKLVM